MAKRIISFDIVRGWAILGNLMVHTFMLTSQIQKQAETNVDELSVVGFILMVFIVIFGHWRGLFLLISAAVHMFMMQIKLRKGIKREVILVQELLKGILLWVWAMFFYVFLAQWSISKEWATEQPVVIDWRKIYHADQFANIAWAIMIAAVVFYILTSSEKLKKPLVMASVFGALGLLFIFAAPYSYQAANNFWGVDLHIEAEHLANIGEKGWWDYIVRMLGNQFNARESPLFPHFAYSAVGSILGIYISQEKKPDKKKFLGWGYGLAGFSIILGIFWLFVVDIMINNMPTDLDTIFNFHVHPTWFVFVTIGMLLFLFLGLMHGLEFNRKVNWKRRLKISRFSRRVGFLSLTVYSFGSLQAVWRVLYDKIFPAQGFRESQGLNLGFTILLMATEIIAWFGILWLWEKGNFIFSLEWWFALVLKRPYQMKDKDRVKLYKDFLDVKGRVIEVTPVHFVEPFEKIVVEKPEGEIASPSI